jgi:hypothetical protein
MTWQKWGSKQALEKRKTSLSLMEVINMQSLQILRTFKYIFCAYVQGIKINNEYIHRVYCEVL